MASLIPLDEDDPDYTPPGQPVDVYSTPTSPVPYHHEPAFATFGVLEDEDYDIRFITELTGPQGETGPRGLPGMDSVPADEAVGAYIQASESSTRTSLDSVLSDHIFEVPNGSITAPKLSESAVTESSLSDFSVSAVKLRTSKHILY